MAVEVGHLGIVRLTGADLEALRRECYRRDHGRCVICEKPVRWEPGYWNSMHMAHSIARGAGGSDVLSNVKSKCHGCHSAEHNPRAVAKKVSVQ